MSVVISMKLTQKQTGALYMRKLALEDENKNLKSIIQKATKRLLMPINQIKGDEVGELITDLKKILGET